MHYQNDIKIEQNDGSLLENIDNFQIKPEPYEVGGVLGKNQLNKKEMLDFNGPYLLEVCVNKEENVFPMIPSGSSVSDIRLE